MLPYTGSASGIQTRAGRRPPLERSLATPDLQVAWKTARNLPETKTPPTIECLWRGRVTLLVASRCKWKDLWQCLQSPDSSTQQTQSCTESLVFCGVVYNNHHCCCVRQHTTGHTSMGSLCLVSVQSPLYISWRLQHPRIVPLHFCDRPVGIEMDRQPDPTRPKDQTSTVWLTSLLRSRHTAMAGATVRCSAHIHGIGL